ncbi:MAG: iron-containing alcohol dehydrogenase [Anaerolineae bacterium]|jgi:alcohol dehydrogenase class IV
MWHFVSPEIVFGEGALQALDRLQGRLAFIVTDVNLVELGLVGRVESHLNRAGLGTHVFDAIQPEPTVDTVQHGAKVAREVVPDWIVGLGGGSPMDAAKAIWVLYERPDLRPAEINPFIDLGLRQRAHLVTIPTTSGTGAEVTWAIVLTDAAEQRKMGLGNRENVADLAVVDPGMAASMPPQLTADTGLDALTHAVEAYTCTWHTDMTDGLCVKAARDIFQYLPRAVENGADMEVRERLHNAATCAGLGFGNAMASMAHAMGHATGSQFHLPHGRSVGLFLPYSIEFAAGRAPERFADLARHLGLTHADGEKAARVLSEHVRGLIREIGNPAGLAELGIERVLYEAQVEKLVDDAFNDTQMVTAARPPSYDELRQLYVCAYAGREVDF